MIDKYDKSGFGALLGKMAAFYGSGQDIFENLTFFEIILLIILLRNSNQTNALAAFRKLREFGLSSPYFLSVCDETKLADVIHYAGCQKKKARTISAIACEFVVSRQNVCEFYFCDRETAVKILVKIPGIGIETADLISLYALDKPYFALNQYSRRFFVRYGILDSEGNDDVRSLEKHINDDYSGDLELIKKCRMAVEKHSKEYCRNTPRCRFCILRKECGRIIQ